MSIDRLFAVSVSLALLPLTVYAQTPAPSPPPEWSGEAGLSYVQTGGNTDTQTVGLSAKGLRQTRQWKAEARGAFLRTESADLVTAKKWTALGRGDRSLTERLSAYGQTTFLRDLFAGIERENAFDAGALLKLLLGPRHTLSTTAGLAYTTESRIAPAEDRSFLGSRFGAAYRLKIREGSEAGADADYLLAFGDPGASRAHTALTLTSALGRVLALRVSHQLSYVREPVPGKKKTDTELLASIVARWPPPR